MLKELFKKGESNMGKKHIDEIARNISYLRKQREMTQDALAEKLGVTFQAVSKWENSVSCPDIELLPELARIFNVTVDYLFGIEKIKEVPKVEPAQQSLENVNMVSTEIKNKDLPWEDDNELRAVIYIGRSLIDPSKYPINNDRKFKFIYEGEAINVTGYMDIECGDVEGNVNAGNGLKCNDVSGNASAGNGIECSDVGGNISAGNSVNCGDVDSSVSAGGNITCGDADGNVSAGGNVDCGDVDGDISSGGSVKCGDVDGEVSSGGEVTCNDVDGDINTGGNVKCHDVRGDVAAGNNVECNDIDGGVEASTVKCRDISGDVEADTIHMYKN